MVKTVIVRLTGKVELQVSGSAEAEILRKANDMVSEMDFGEMEDIDWESNIAPWDR